LRNADTDAWQRFLIKRHFSSAVAKAWSAYARPSIRLVPSELLPTDETAPWTSKLGGSPDLPIGVDWPSRDAYRYSRQTSAYKGDTVWNAQPLSFVAQINLSDVAETGCDLPLPDAGLLLFFYDAEIQPWGFDPLDAPGAQVIFVAPETPTHRRVDPQHHLSPVRSLRLAPQEGLPGWEWIAGRLSDYAKGAYEAFSAQLSSLSDEDWQAISPGGHQFAGWPCPVQAPMERECEMASNGMVIGHPITNDVALAEIKKRSDEWRLLLQIDSDDDLGWMWGDGGTIYFLCREADIAQKRFDRGWTVLQCC